MCTHPPRVQAQVLKALFLFLLEPKTEGFPQTEDEIQQNTRANKAEYQKNYYKTSISSPQPELLVQDNIPNLSPPSCSSMQPEGTCGKRTLQQLHTQHVQGEGGGNPSLYLTEKCHTLLVPRCSNLLQLFHKCLVSYYWSESCQIAHHKL